MVASAAMKIVVAGEREGHEGGKTEVGAETKIGTEEIGILTGVHQKERVDRAAAMMMMMMTGLDYRRII